MVRKSVAFLELELTFLCSPFLGSIVDVSISKLVYLIFPVLVGILDSFDSFVISLFGSADSVIVSLVGSVDSAVTGSAIFILEES